MSHKQGNGTSITPPGPRTWSPLGFLIHFIRDPVRFLSSLANDYGDIVRFRIRNRQVLLLRRPDEIEGVLVRNHKNFVKNPGFQNITRILGNGLLSSEGSEHLRQRRMIQPFFHQEKIAAYSSVMVKWADQVASSWKKRETIDIDREMNALAMNIVAEALFGEDLQEETKVIGRAVDDAMSLFSRASSPTHVLLERFPFLKDTRFTRGRERLDRAIYDIIASRKERGGSAKDLLGYLLDARDVEGSMSDHQVRDEALTLLLAGHETTAVALSWVWFLLSTHPEVEALLHAELESVLGGTLPTPEDVPRLSYTRMVVLETMRMYPPVYMIGRAAIEDYPVGDYVVLAGSTILMSQYITHRDPRFFPDPERFDPLRWRESEVGSRARFSYFPFGGGPRICIGEPFALQEAILAIAVIAQRWVLRTPSQVEILPRVTLRPKGGMPGTIHSRDLW